MHQKYEVKMIQAVPVHSTVSTRNTSPSFTVPTCPVAGHTVMLRLKMHHTWEKCTVWPVMHVQEKSMPQQAPACSKCSLM